MSASFALDCCISQANWLQAYKMQCTKGYYYQGVCDWDTHRLLLYRHSLQVRMSVCRCSYMSIILVDITNALISDLFNTANCTTGRIEKAISYTLAFTPLTSS